VIESALVDDATGAGHPAGDPAVLVRLRGAGRTYGRGAQRVRALRDVNLTLRRGELVAVVGPSGSGKSTLLNLVGTLDRPTAGTVEIDGLAVDTIGDRKLAALRAHRIGFVFQHFHLADNVPALDNVADGLLYTGLPRRARRQYAEAALRRVGLHHRLHHRPHELSGGERQRTAIARAVAGNPPLLLADEPTGALDTRSGEIVLHLLHALHESGTTVVTITHDAGVAARMGRQLRMRDGLLVSDSLSPDGTVEETS
jgi:putative ABC transport system ATP-binding protein